MEQTIPCINDIIENRTISISILRYYRAINKYERHMGIYIDSHHWDLLQDAKKIALHEHKIEETEFNKRFNTYIDAFKEGYNTFDDQILRGGIFKDDNAVKQKILDHAIGGLLNRSSNELLANYWHVPTLFNRWPIAGKNAAYKYRAWYHIVDHHEVFASFFEKKDLPKSAVLDEVIAVNGVDTTVNKYVLLHELGIIQLLKDNYRFDEMKRSVQIALLKMILGLNDKGYDSLKGILSAVGTKGKNNPLKEKNIQTVRGELTKLGIIKDK